MTLIKKDSVQRKDEFDMTITDDQKYKDIIK